MKAEIEGASRLALRMQRMQQIAEEEMTGELDECAQLLGRRISQLAPKFRSLLALGVTVRKPEPLTRDVGPTASYAAAQEDGVRPGGKGLPRFDDPDSTDIVAWLRTKAFKGPRRRRGAAAILAELRDRYEGLAWHVRHHGIKARPFVQPAFDQLVRTLQVRLQAAGERATARGAQA